ncbi:hypothetical protein GCM10009533_30170 [Saccharopolyspora spinosporotrichia]|uniref:Uncharacterized protein n=1 Tax=Saccharopolyspora erythraea TaxID=1836 RepID=A0ABP3MVF3_SACER
MTAPTVVPTAFSASRWWRLGIHRGTDENTYKKQDIHSESCLRQNPLGAENTEQYYDTYSGQNSVKTDREDDDLLLYAESFVAAQCGGEYGVPHDKTQCYEHPGGNLGNDLAYSSANRSR